MAVFSTTIIKGRLLINDRYYSYDPKWVGSAQLGKGSFGEVYPYIGPLTLNTAAEISLPPKVHQEGLQELTSSVLRSLEPTIIPSVDVLSKIAVKIIDPRYSNINVFQEVDLIRRINSENVVKFYGYDEPIDGPHSYMLHIFMEQMLLSLESLKRSGLRIPEPFLITVARSLVAAMNDLLSVKILHRDIKPDNILIGFDGKIFYLL